MAADNCQVSFPGKATGRQQAVHSEVGSFHDSSICELASLEQLSPSISFTGWIRRGRRHDAALHFLNFGAMACTSSFAASKPVQLQHRLPCLPARSTAQRRCRVQAVAESQRQVCNCTDWADTKRCCLRSRNRVLGQFPSTVQ